MTHIVVLGHGTVAPILLETARMVTGPVGSAEAIDFPPGSSADDLAGRLATTIDAADDEILVLTDIAGGSPSRVALGEALAGRAEVVTGTNLPMLVTALFAADRTPARELAHQIVPAARSGVQDLGARVRGEEETS